MSIIEILINDRVAVLLHYLELRYFYLVIENCSVDFTLAYCILLYLTASYTSQSAPDWDPRSVAERAPTTSSMEDVPELSSCSSLHSLPDA